MIMSLEKYPAMKGNAFMDRREIKNGIPTEGIYRSVLNLRRFWLWYLKIISTPQHMNISDLNMAWVMR